MVRQSLRSPVGAIKRIILRAKAEDAVSRDVTGALIAPATMARARIIAKSPAVLAGIDCLRGFGSAVKCRPARRDGEVLRRNDVVAVLLGPARVLLGSERVVLNLMARMSGIATLTRRYVERLARGSRVKILDTRKTTPMLRAIEKYAVVCGGGVNHRMNLADAVFIKDNHLAVEPLDELSRRVRRKKGVPLIIEADRLSIVKEALEIQPDRILLDNMGPDQLRRSIALIRSERRRIEIEVSGGITLERVRSLSRLDIDFISVGSLTHSAPAADLSLEITNVTSK